MNFDLLIALYTDSIVGVGLTHLRKNPSTVPSPAGPTFDHTADLRGISNNKVVQVVTPNKFPTMFWIIQFQHRCSIEPVQKLLEKRKNTAPGLN